MIIPIHGGAGFLAVLGRLDGEGRPVHDIACGETVFEGPVTMAPRRHGVSQMRGLAPLVYVPKMLWYIAGVYRR